MTGSRPPDPDKGAENGTILLGVNSVYSQHIQVKIESSLFCEECSMQLDGIPWKVICDHVISHFKLKASTVAKGFGGLPTSSKS